MRPSLSEFAQYSDLLDTKRVSEKVKRAMESSELPTRQASSKQMGELPNSSRYLANMSVSEYKQSMRIDNDALSASSVAQPVRVNSISTT